MTGFVYFIGPTDWRLNRVKIGHTTTSPKCRMDSMQTGSPFPLEVRGFFRAGPEVEKLLHRTFAPLREHGEWFRMDGKLLALVSCIYFENFGRAATPETMIDRLLNENLLTDEPPHPLFCTPDEWMGSADITEINEWLHDRAWAAYQASQVAE